VTGSGPLTPSSLPLTPKARAVVGAVIVAVVSTLFLTIVDAIFAQSGQGAGATTTGPGGATAPAGPTEAGGATGQSPCLRKRLHLRCPDLIMSAPSHLHMDRSTIPGRVLLRATSSINNRGGGPLELRAHRTGAHSWAVYQAIYDRAHRPHLFRRPAASLVFKYVPGERYGYGDVGGETYWKFEHAAAFQLWSINARFKAIRLVRRGPKIDYCLRDLVHSHPSSDSPSSPAYPACNREPQLRRNVLGTSVGWSDVYPYEYPQQWIDVTGLRGRFAYVQVADPNALLIERNHRNNLSETYVALPSGRVLGHRIAAAAP
jgi:lysyl oxidase